MSRAGVKNDNFNKIEQAVKKSLSRSNGAHDWYHTERVLHLCLHIGKKEKADLTILTLAALLHDIARPDEEKTKGQICHAEVGAQKARRLLKSSGFSEEIITQVVHCIEAHRFRKNNPPQTKEAKILFDADKLDSIGAVGIGRAFIFAAGVGATVHIKELDPTQTKSYSKEDTAYREFLVKLKHIKSKMLTKEGRRLATSRHKFMGEFFRRLDEEVGGEA